MTFQKSFPLPPECDVLGPILGSLEALATMGTEESLQTIQEIRDQWYPEFNQTQKRIADKFLAESHAAKCDEQ